MDWTVSGAGPRTAGHAPRGLKGYCHRAMKAELIYSVKRSYADGAILEAVVWKAAKPVPGSVRSYKYRLFCGYMITGSGVR